MFLRKHYPMIIPLIMLLFAVLACDDMGYLYEPPRVSLVKADPQIPGKAYALVEGYPSGYADPNTPPKEVKLRLVYQTSNYGESWQLSTDLPLFAASSDVQIYPRGESLMFGDTLIWTFPHRVFRDFFTQGGAYHSTSEPYYGSYATLKNIGTHNSVSPVDPGVIWIAMDSQGVLVGPNPLKPSDRPWRLMHKGIVELRPIPLTISDPYKIIAIILAALLIPPLPLMHTYMLSQVYRYAFPPEKSRHAIYWATWVTSVITVLATVAITIWLTDIRYDYYEIVNVMTGISCVLGTGTAFYLGLRRKSVYGFVPRITFVAGLASLVVPAGVAAVWFGWFAVITFIIGLMMCRAYLHQYVKYMGNDVPYWQIDKAALSIVPGGVILVPIAGFLVFAGVGNLLITPLGAHIAVILGAILTFFIARKLLSQPDLSRNKQKDKVMKTGGVVKQVEDVHPFRDRRFESKRWGYILGWFFGSILLSIVIFIAQGWASGWFVQLLE